MACLLSPLTVWFGSRCFVSMLEVTAHWRNRLAITGGRSCPIGIRTNGTIPRIEFGPASGHPGVEGEHSSKTSGGPGYPRNTQHGDIHSLPKVNAANTAAWATTAGTIAIPIRNAPAKATNLF